MQPDSGSEALGPGEGGKVETCSSGRCRWKNKKKKGVKGMEGKSKGRGEGVRQPGKTDGEE